MHLHFGFRLGTAALILSGAMFGQGHNTSTPQRPPETSKVDDASVARGHTEFKSSCGFCHGEDATGGRGPDLVRSTLVQHDDHGNVLGPMIRNGRPDKGMPSFASLKEGELADIIGFLHHQADAALHSANVPGDYPLKKLLTGNADEGKAFFFGAGGCSGCHSVATDLKGIASRMSPVDLQQNMVYPQRRNAPRPTAIVTTKSGERFQGTLMQHDEFRIALKCDDGWYRSWPTDQVQADVHDPLLRHRELMAIYTDADMHNLFAFLETLK